MKVLITGSFGNIGEKVVHELLKQKHQVTCLDLNNKTNQKVAKKFGSRISTVWGDITNAQQVAEVIKPVDAVIHMAALLPATVDVNPALGEKVNIGGTQNVINGIKASSKKIHLVFCSSISVHGNNTPDGPYPRKITDPLKGEDGYASQKIACEKLLDESGLDVTIMRIGACLDAGSTGIGGSPKDSITLLFKTHPDCRIEHVYPSDVALALVNALGNPEAIGKKFFLGGGKKNQSTWIEFSSIGFRAMGLGNAPRELFGTAPFYTEWMDTAEAQRVLKYQTKTLADFEKEMFQKFAPLRLSTILLRPLIKKWIYSQAPKK